MCQFILHTWHFSFISINKAISINAEATCSEGFIYINKLILSKQLNIPVWINFFPVWFLPFSFQFKDFVEQKKAYIIAILAWSSYSRLGFLAQETGKNQSFVSQTSPKRVILAIFVVMRYAAYNFVCKFRVILDKSEASKIINPNYLSKRIQYF